MLGGSKSCTDSTGSGIRDNEAGEAIMTEDNHVSGGDSSVGKSCLLMQVILHNFYLLVWVSFIHSICFIFLFCNIAVITNCIHRLYVYCELYYYSILMMLSSRPKLTLL